LGAKGMEQIVHIMDHLRNTKIESFGKFRVAKKRDRRQGEPQPHLSKTDTSARNMLIYNIDKLPDTAAIKITVRPSGTEPKIKMYFEVMGNPCRPENLKDEQNKIVGIRQELEKTLMQYCYQLLGVDFPDRGFLLFWQLPLDDKLKYFEIEDEIVKLKNTSDTRTRKAELDQLLLFLGANPIEKVDKAFREKHKAGILEYLGLAEAR
jgi:hypothetical protein